MKRLCLLALFTAIFGSSIFYYMDGSRRIGEPFPGFLTFENHVFGALNQLEWPGAKAGLKYRDLIKPVAPNTYSVSRGDDVIKIVIQPKLFSASDFMRVFYPPFISGGVFIFLAGAIFWFMRGQMGAWPLLLFNLGVGYFLVACFDFQTSYHASWFFLLNFNLIPAYMTHFAMVYPEPHPVIAKKPVLLVVPYVLSSLLAIPYIGSFYTQPLNWPFWEGIAIGYSALSYLFWLIRLYIQSQSPQQESHRIIARSILIGQAVAFVVPLVIFLYFISFRENLPLNWAAPITMIFPLATLFGMIWGRLKKTQMELVQKAKMASLGQLLSGVAHEINNPTNFIFSNLGPLKEYVAYLKNNMGHAVPPFKGQMPVSEVLADLDRLVDDIEEGARRTQVIVQDLRQFGHSEESITTPIQVRNCIEGTLNLLRDQWRDRIQVTLDCDRGLTVTLNPGRFSQVIMNLLSNAIQAISGKGTITIDARVLKEMFVLKIKDTGTGIHPNNRHRIFDPFFTTKEQGEGTGLGLSLVQGFIKDWKGTIEVQSEWGKGTEFCVTLPINRCTA